VNRRPSITQLGRVDNGVVHGWGLGLCSRACWCHRHPSAGHLTILEDQAAGTLGLASFTAGECGCCEPWSAEELAAVLRDVAAAEALSA
jgi:hypothetical protein